ncbi:MAG: Phage protein [uncultured Clostridium sp.]
MANSIKLDWRNQDIKYIPGSDIEFITEDRTEKVKLTDEQFEDLFDQYRESIGEKTVSELEDKILELEVALENAYEVIEVKEQQEDLMREKFFDCTY